MTFQSMTLPSGNENSERESNLIPKRRHTYLSRSTFLVQSKVKSVEISWPCI